MLVLSRKKNESIVINNDITVTVVEIRGDKVRLGIVAPKEVPVHRQEVFDAIHGKVRLDGAPVDQWSSQALGRHIGYLPQDMELFFGTVAQNIARLDPKPPSEQVIAAARAAGIHEMILSLPKGLTEGVIQAPTGATQFSSLALFSPDAQLILSSSGADGRLQLWHSPLATMIFSPPSRVVSASRSVAIISAIR